MNDGFIALWLLTIGIILYATGWERQAAEGISRRWLAALLVFMALLQSFEMDLGGGLKMTWSAMLLAGVSIGWAVADWRAMQLAYLIACSLLSGLLWLWIQFMYAADPVFIVLNPEWDGPLSAGLLAGIVVERFRSQQMVIMLAALIAAAGGTALSLSQTTPLTVGSFGWWDGFVVALAAGRMTAGLKSYLRRLGGWLARLLNRVEQ